MIGRALVQPGDNIVQLASRLTGDPSRWPELVSLNRLTPPYVADVSGPGVLGPASVIQFPLSGLPSPIPSEQLEALTYKRDMTTNRRGNLLLENREPRIEAGLTNLATALARRLRTPVGAHPFHPEYGSLLRSHLGKPADQVRLDLVALDARKALLRDPRVESVDVTAVWENELLTIHYTVTPIPPGTIFADTLRL